MSVPEEELLACEVCLKEIPLSEATSEEASDYVVHFCGLACYERWRDEQAAGQQAADDT